MSDTPNIVIRISSVWPPTPGHQHVVVWAHRDGRRVKYVRGLAVTNDAQKALLAKRGNINGTHGSVDIWESFPDEDVCMGCVAPVQRYNIREDGRHADGWWSSSPDFKHGVRSEYCPSCLERETAEVRERYERDMRYLGHANAGLDRQKEAR